MSKMIDSIAKELDGNNGMISFAFIEGLVEEGTVQHFHLTDNMRVCVIRLESGHEVLGKAQVLNAENDNQEKGEQVAYENAVGELWAVCGSIAKAL